MIPNPKKKKKKVSSHVQRVCNVASIKIRLETAYLVEIEIFLLKIP